MLIVQQRKVGFEMAYGGTGCFEEPQAGVVARVRGAPTRLLSALLGAGLMATYVKVYY